MKGMTIQDALALLKLEDFASILDVKRAYRELAHRYHPDKCKDARKKFCEEKFKKIHEAKTLLIEYCENYPVPFSEKAVRREARKNEFSEHYRQFYGDWFGDLEK